MIDSSLVFDGTYSATTSPTWTGGNITGNATSANVLDLLVGRDIGAGIAPDLELHVDVTTAFTASGNSTLEVDFQVSPDNGNWTTILRSVPAVVTDLSVVGAPFFRYRVPINQILNDTAGVLKAPGRYLRLQYVVGVGNFTAGAVLSYLSADRNEFTVYNNNYTANVASGEI